MTYQGTNLGKVSFPKEIPYDYELEKDTSDTSLVRTFVKKKTNCFEFFHQLGVLETWFKNADQSTDAYKAYARIPEIAHKYAFESANGCSNVYNKIGCSGNLSSKIYVIKSIVPQKDMDPQLHAAIEKDSLSTSSTRKDGATIIIWVASNDIIGENGSVLALLDRQQKFCKTLEHGVWKQIPSKMKTLLEKQYSLENGYDLNSITLQQLNPYQAVVETKGNNTVIIKFDEMQFAVGHSFVEGTYFHTRALERLTNPLFRKSSTDVYKRTKMATTIEGGDCRVSKNRDPPSLQHSYP